MQVKCCLLCGRCHISCICEVLLSISGAGHIRQLCKMHFGTSVILYDFEPVRCENICFLLSQPETRISITPFQVCNLLVVTTNKQLFVFINQMCLNKQLPQR